MPLPVGALAPAFTLPTVSDGEVQRISLADHLGKDVVVLLFFPAVNTPVCTHQMCHSKDEIPALEDAVVYGISVDLPWAQSMWAQANNIPVTLLSDHDLSDTTAYDAVWPSFAGIPVSARASFVIDRNGTISYSDVTPTLGDLPDAGQLQRAVESALS